MNKFLLSTALAGLLSVGSAVAQGEHHDAGHGGGAPHPQGGGASHAAPAAHAGPAMHAGPRDHGEPRPVAGGAMGHDYHPGAVPGGAPAMPMHHDAHTEGPRPGSAMAGHTPDAAMRGPRSGGNFNAYHRNFTAPRQFHIGSYRRPSGWYAHRWTYGEVLPSLFWSQNYWIGDFNDYGLMPPPPGTIWVRNGADALLIDQDSGEVVQVEYGVFD